MKSPLLGPVQLYTVISPEPPEKSRASDRMSDVFMSVPTLSARSSTVPGNSARGFLLFREVIG